MKLQALHNFQTTKIGKTARAIMLGVMLTGASVAVTGCSPQEKSYWTKSFTALPDPPSNARLQLGVSTEDDGKIFINYVVWDDRTNQFKRQDIHYSTTTLKPGTYFEMGGYEQRIKDGEVLYGGAIVDQANKKILLSDGNYVDGPTGDVFDAQGNLVKRLSK